MVEAPPACENEKLGNGPERPARRKFKPVVLTLLIVNIAFLITGIVTTMLGPMLPRMVSHWSLNDAQAGRLFLAQFLGGFCGSILAGQLMSWWSARRAVVAGLALGAAGVSAVWAGHLATAMGALFCYGAGMGITAPATNMFVAHMASRHRAAALNLLNFSWTAGAVISAPAIAVLFLHFQPRTAIGGIAALMAAAALAVLARRTTDREQPDQHMAGNVGGLAPPPLVIMAALLLFLYVGVENSVAGWLPSYCARFFPGAFLAPVAQTTFWSALLAGRLLASALLRKLTTERLVQVGLMVASVGIAALLLSSTRPALLIAAALTGAGLAVVLPTTVAVVAEYLGPAADRIMGFLFALAGLGGAVLPTAVGYISARAGGLRNGLLLAVGASLAMVALQLQISRLVRARASFDLIVPG